MKIVVPGDFIAQGVGLTAGHGTFESKNDEEEDFSNAGKIYASVAGVVHKIDNYISVKPLKRVYRPDIGDLVLGRIVSVQKNAWQVDIGSYQHATLNLASVTLPGGEQRRRSEEDQLAMRSIYKENDVVSAEIQQVGMHDGRISLQTRNKNGKLYNGFLFKVDSNIVRRQKVQTLDLTSYGGVSCIVGTNGYIWVQPSE